MKIREELSAAKRRLISVVSTVAFLALWIVVTLPIIPGQAIIPPPAVDSSSRPDIGIHQEDVAQGMTNAAGEAVTSTMRPLIPAQILPSPLAVLRAIAYLHTDQALVRSAAASFWRVTAGFLLAALVAIPLGIIMGSYPPIRAAIEPLSNPLRYLPISAVTGIFMLLFGIDDTMKIMFLFAGSVVYLLPIVVECVAGVDQVYLDTAYTLGGKPRQIITRVLVPGAWPGIIEACRIIYGVGWTYVILAEVVNAEYGLGHLITIAYKRAHIDWAYALVFIVLLLGVGTNEVFRQVQKRWFAWREA